MTREEAQRYCKENGIAPVLSREERLALSKEDFRVWSWGHSPQTLSEAPNQEWARRAEASAAAAIGKRERIRQLRSVAESSLRGAADR